MKKIILLTFLSSIIFLYPRHDADKVSAAPSIRYNRSGKASWYSRHSPGVNKRTANNEIFDDQDLTCAIWGVSFNRHIRVTNTNNGKSIIVRVNDRGPHPRFVREGRIIDLTEQAFSRLGATKNGLIPVEIEFL